jgi:DinB superfamily
VVGPIFEGCERVQNRLVGRLPALGPEELGLRASPDGWPIWELVSHLAGARVYWLCGVLREPGAEATAFPDPLGEEGWEDRLDVPRGAEELLFAVESSWRIVASCLERWTPEMLDQVFTRELASAIQRHRACESAGRACRTWVEFSTV